jgi:hypothetical protein
VTISAATAYCCHYLCNKLYIWFLFTQNFILLISWVFCVTWGWPCWPKHVVHNSKFCTINVCCGDGRITSIQLDFQSSIHVKHVCSCSSAATRVIPFEMHDLTVQCYQPTHVEMHALTVQCYQPTHVIRLITFLLHETVLFAKPTGRCVFTTCIHTCQYLDFIGCSNSVSTRHLHLAPDALFILRFAMQSELHQTCSVSASCCCCEMSLR